jgi:tol-pal system protein YbgF
MEDRGVKMWRKGFVILATGAALTGCVTTQDQVRMERDLNEMKRRLADVERTTVTLRQNHSGQAGEVQGRVENIGRTQADLQASLDALRVELQAMSGRVEDTRREGEGVREELTLVRDDLSLKIGALENRLSAVEKGQARTSAQPAAQAETPQMAYDRGVALIQKNQFAQGREVLEAFLNANPSGSLAVNAMYWIGEAYYGEKRYENAILQFQDVIQKHGDHPKAASALLKQGITFDTLGDERNGRVILNRLVETFPMSEEAKKAKERLAEWDRRR